MEPRWCSLKVSSAAMIADSTTVYALGEGGSVQALRAANGSVLWQHSYPELAAPFDIVSPPALFLGEGLPYLATRGQTAYASPSPLQLLVLKASDGTLLWNRENEPALAATVADGTIYQGGQETLEALQGPTGQQLWHQPLQSKPTA